MSPRPTALLFICPEGLDAGESESRSSPSRRWEAEIKIQEAHPTGAPEGPSASSAREQICPRISVAVESGQDEPPARDAKGTGSTHNNRVEDKDRPAVIKAEDPGIHRLALRPTLHQPFQIDTGSGNLKRPSLLRAGIPYLLAEASARSVNLGQYDDSPITRRYPRATNHARSCQLSSAVQAHRGVRWAHSGEEFRRSEGHEVSWGMAWPTETIRGLARVSRHVYRSRRGGEAGGHSTKG
ncbi:hypothetical protein C8A00DRAFT_30483 [Chaetomidium leptoderma]|uniref:Uncharacterized protein n=1 Tax=Chaetomidium leptoderma TaxID=669021 RepID=A0AAN6VUD0_9PEZI|nr:hypothetical protein C8A00DRAFT_30483 [Chaetomidium leptoderma]